MTFNQSTHKAALKSGEKKLRTRKCAVCKTPFQPFRSLESWCSPGCGLAVSRERLAKRERKEIKERKEAIKTRSDWMREAQQAFNAYRREVCRLAGYTCPCCDKPLDWSGNNVDAGHYRSVGSAPHMRFVENNVWAQRKQCNRYGAGRAVDYRIGLINLIGIDSVEVLEADNEPRKYTIDDLKAIKAEYKAKLKQLLAGRD